ncbi:MAG: hypothetical protein ACOC8F_07735 [Planctomycetota bacterium]
MSKQTILAMAIGAVLGGLVVWACVEDPRAAAQDDPRAGRWDDREPPRPPRGHHEPRLTDEQEAKLLEFLQRYRPRRHTALMALKDHNPRMYHRWLGRIWRVYQQFHDSPEEVRRAVLRLWDYRVEIGKTLRELRDATGERREELVGELRRLVAARFDDEQTVNRYRLTVLAEHLERLRERWKQRRQRRDEIVAEHLADLLEHGEDREAGSLLPRGRRHRGPTRPTTRPGE